MKMAQLDSKNFVEIPQREIVEPAEYRLWLVEKVERKWMQEFNSRNKFYHHEAGFNTECAIVGYFGNSYLDSKFYRYDGTIEAVSDCYDYRTKRGFLIRDHYSEEDVAKVQLITDNLIEFLEQERIEYTRRNFWRG